MSEFFTECKGRIFGEKLGPVVLLNGADYNAASILQRV